MDLSKYEKYFENYPKFLDPLTMWIKAQDLSFVKINENNLIKN